MKSTIYIVVFAVLVGSTAAELQVIGLPMPHQILIATIIGLAGVKAALIALFFQHLKNEPKSLSMIVLLSLLGVVVLISISMLSILPPG